MNRKKVKKQKRHENRTPNEKNPSEEVLVLPPNLLEKLGINLGNVQLNQMSPCDFSRDNSSSKVNTVVNKQIVKQQKNFIQTNNNSKKTTEPSSIIETANLMKKSVFLSPTFNTSQPFVVSNQLGFDDLKQSETYFTNNIESMVVCNKGEIEMLKNVNEYKDSNIGDGHHNNDGLSTDKNIPIHSSRSDKIQEELNEINKCLSSNKSSELKNKINIISEEVIDTLSLNKFKPIDTSSKKVFVSVPIDTIISKTKINISGKESNIEHIPGSDKNIKDIEIKHINCNTITISLASDNGSEAIGAITHNNQSLENLSINGQQPKKSVESNCNVKIVSELETNSIAEMSNSCTNLESENYNVIEEKATEIRDINKNISEILSPIKISLSPDIKDNSISNINNIDKGFDHSVPCTPCTDKIVKDDILEKCNSKELFFNSKQNKITSKLSVQGVEKPGGETEVNIIKKTIKTYTNKNKYKKQFISQNLTNMDEQLKNNTNIDITAKVNCTDINFIQQFCHCLDFGNLHHCDVDGNYEHLHFSKSNKSDCSSEIVFGIYDDNSECYDYDKPNFDPNSYETLDSVYNLCYNAIRITEDDIAHDNLKIGDERKNMDARREENLTNLKETINREYKSFCCDLKDLEKHKSELPIEKSFEKHNSKSKKRKKSTATLEECTSIDHIPCKIRKKNLRTLESESRDSLESSINNKQDNALDNVNIQQEKNNETVKRVKCGVCQAEIDNNNWTNHIAETHKYLACREGELAIELNDSDQIQQHLQKIEKEIGKLMCFECGGYYEFVEFYLQHLKNCSGSRHINKLVSETAGAVVDAEISVKKIKSQVEVDTLDVTCAVCHKVMSRDQWLDHLGREHAYFAWEAGHKSLDLADKDDIYQHLNNIFKRTGELTCYNCFINENNVDSYVKHVKDCGSTVWSQSILIEKNVEVEEGDVEMVQCGVCQRRLPPGEWAGHNAAVHGYLAWRVGEPKLDLDDEEAVHSHLYRVSKEIGGLLCTKCGQRRKYIKSYLQHTKKCVGQLNLSIDSLNDTLNESVVSVSNKTLETTLPEPQEVRSSAGLESDVGTGRREVVCGVCGTRVSRREWCEHAGQYHAYLAWRKGDPPLNVENEDEVNEHLQRMLKKVGELVCYKCNSRVKTVKKFLLHVKKCRNSTLAACDKSTEKPAEVKEVECGVCQQRVPADKWMDHIAKEHNYLAWKEGQPALDLKDQKIVHDHLYAMCKELGGLTCRTCGARRKYVKPFLQHVQKCDADTNVTLDSTMNDSLNESALSESLNGTLDTSTTAARGEGAHVTCGVCGAGVAASEWAEHARRSHRYLTWREGDKPLNLDNEEEVHDHLYNMNRKYNGLKCDKCDVTRKYVKAYLSHVGACDVVNVGGPALTDLDVYECAVCAEKVDPKKWKSHAMDKHYNVAWVVGENPIDVKNPFAVEKYLKEYKVKKHKMVCGVCGLTRASYAGFYAHVIQCGKKEEEIDMYRDVCDICNNKYLAIYKYQHQSMHREQESAKLRKLHQEEKKNDNEEPVEVTGRRRAAERAKTVIEKYKNQGAFKCSSCGFGAEDENDLKDHVCQTKDEGSSDEGSGKYASASSEEDSFESGAESDHSGDQIKAENKHGGKKRHSDTMAAQVQRIPFTVKNVESYLAEYAEDFCNIHLTSEDLFPNWRTCTYEPVASEELPQYLPLLKVSCKVRVCGDLWVTYDQFEARNAHGIASMFVGGGIQCISWAPAVVRQRGGAGGGAERAGHLLAVACHRDADAPRLDADQTYRHTNMLQIWDYGNMDDSLPEFVLGIAHEYGTVWAMDWCPSGARDSPLGSTGTSRLGLLGVACSDGSAYIYSVPYPSTITKNDQLVYKLKPVAELRFSRGARKIYQATSITWSVDKGHSTVVVGYAEGTIAYFDARSTSPLLAEAEGALTVLYPYDEERRHKSCITDLSSFPDAAGGEGGASGAGGVLSAAASTGASLSVGGVTLRSPVPSAQARFVPHWPAVLLAGEQGIVSHGVNELECWGVGRRFGAVQCWCGCRRCGAAAAFAPPALRRAYTHPAHGYTKTHDVALIQMRPLDSRVKKVKSDALAVKLEPTRYEDASRVYGVELRRLTGTPKNNSREIIKNRELTPERYPLADVPSMAFCPSAAHHRKLAVATHCGVVFLITL